MHAREESPLARSGSSLSCSYARFLCFESSQVSLISEILGIGNFYIKAIACVKGVSLWFAESHIVGLFEHLPVVALLDWFLAIFLALVSVQPMHLPDVQLRNQVQYFTPGLSFLL